MKLLLTGANGFVGINILNEIIRHTQWDITCFIHKHSDNLPEGVKKVYSLDIDCHYDFIIHAGGNPSSKSCIENPDSAFSDNIQFTFHLLEFSRKNNIKNIIFLSSCEVYGYATENSVETDMLISYNMYGASKVACEHMLSAYYHSYGISSVSIRLLNTFGPYCQKERFPSIVKSKFETEENPHFILSSSGSKRWLDIEEMARRVVFIIKHMPMGCEVFNFVGDKNIALVEFVQLFSNGRPFTYDFVKDELNGYHHEANANGSKFTHYCSEKGLTEL
jgi:nucleoside-diphosphate-sugar epimerase